MKTLRVAFFGASLLALASALGCGKKAGPPPVWTAPLEDHSDLAAESEGALIVVRTDELVALRGGKEAWKAPRPAKTTGWALPLAAGCVLVGDNAGELACFKVSDGTLAWKVTAPVKNDPEPSSPPSASTAAVRDDGRVLLLLSDDRFLLLDPAECAKGASCLSPLGHTEDAEYTDSLVPLVKGAFGLQRDRSLRLFDEKGTRVATLAAKETVFGTVAVKDGSLYAVFDTDLVRIHPVRCATPDAEPVTIGAAPAGCVEKVAAAEDATAPLATTGTGVLFTADRVLRRAGDKTWKSSVDAASAPVVRGDTVYVACWRDNDDILSTLVDLCAVSLDNGSLRFRTKLDAGKVGLLAQPRLLAAGDHLFLSTEKRVAAFKAP